MLVEFQGCHRSTTMGLASCVSRTEVQLISEQVAGCALLTSILPRLSFLCYCGILYPLCSKGIVLEMHMWSTWLIALVTPFWLYDVYIYIYRKGTLEDRYTCTYMYVDLAAHWRTIWIGTSSQSHLANLESVLNKKLRHEWSRLIIIQTWQTKIKGVSRQTIYIRCIINKQQNKTRDRWRLKLE